MKYFLQLVDRLEKGEIAPVNLFYGPEVYLKEQAVSRFKEKLVAPETADFNFDLLDGREVTAGEVAGIARTPPVMGEKRLVVVKRAPYFGNEAPAELLEYVKAPVPTTCLVLEAETVDRRKKLFKAISSINGAVEFARLSSSDLSRWINQLARRSGKKISGDGVELLLNRCGREMYDLYNEMHKLVLYTGDREMIEAGDVRLVVADRGEESIFAVVDALGNRKYGSALEGIRSLLLRKESPQAILGMLSRQVRLMMQAGELSARGYSVQEASRHMGVPPFVCKKALAQSKNFKQEQLVDMLRGILHVDEQVKTGRQDFYPAVEMLFLESCIK